MRPASYIGGMYPLIGRPLYPELWNGCVGAWAPCLGPTGLTLRDWGGLKNSGLLTNMTAATSWVSSQGRYALQFDATDDYVGSLGSQNLSLPLSWSVWFWRVTGDFNQIMGQGDGSSTGIYLNCNTSGQLSWQGVFSNVGTATANAWNHVVCTYDGSTSRIYLNGVELSSTATWGKSNAAASFEIGRVNFSGGFFYNGNGRQIDDVRRYSRAITAREVRLLYSRRGIAYELAPRRLGRVTGFKAYWAARKAQIIGGGL